MQSLDLRSDLNGCCNCRAGTAEECSAEDAGLIAVLKRRIEVDVHRRCNLLGVTKLPPPLVKDIVLRALQAVLPVVHSFWRKVGITGKSSHLLTAEDRLPKQVTRSTRLPYGTAPEGAPVKRFSGFSDQEYAQELPPQPLPVAAGAQFERMRTSHGAVLHALLPDTAAAAGFARSLAMCAAVRDDDYLDAASRRALRGPTADLLAKLPPSAVAADSFDSAAKAAAGSWKRTVAVYTRSSRDDGLLSHNRFARSAASVCRARNLFSTTLCAVRVCCVCSTFYATDPAATRTAASGTRTRRSAHPTSKAVLAAAAGDDPFDFTTRGLVANARQPDTQLTHC
jgi:hypothetical protein